MFVPYESMRQKFHLTIVSIAIFSLVFSGFSSIPPAFATAPIDQSNSLTDGTGIPIQAGVGQGFTPLETDIIAIDVGLTNPCSGTWSVLIHNADIDGSLVAPPIPHSVNADLTQHITFPSISLTPEDLYVIEIISSTTCSWLASTLNPYDRGTAFLGGATIDLDFVFATYHSFGSVGDEDGDGVLDDVDLCSGTPDGVEVDEFGCEIVVDDEDADGVLNDVDDCSGTPEGVEVDEFGCEIITPPTGEKKSCEKLTKENPGKAIGKDKAKEKNNCS